MLHRSEFLLYVLLLEIVYFRNRVIMMYYVLCTTTGAEMIFGCNEVHTGNFQITSYIGLVLVCMESTAITRLLMVELSKNYCFRANM